MDLLNSILIRNMWILNLWDWIRKKFLNLHSDVNFSFMKFKNFLLLLYTLGSCVRWDQYNIVWQMLFVYMLVLCEKELVSYLPEWKANSFPHFKGHKIVGHRHEFECYVYSTLSPEANIWRWKHWKLELAPILRENCCFYKLRDSKGCRFHAVSLLVKKLKF
jgi:hypothetical protein